MSTQIARQHASHGWTVAPAMLTIRNVPRAATQQIMTCSCGWYGWVDRDAVTD